MAVVIGRVCDELRRLGRERGGSIALIFGLAMPVLLGLVGLGVDSASFYNQQSRMQSVADSAAVAVAKELHLYRENPDELEAVGMARTEFAESATIELTAPREGPMAGILFMEAHDAQPGRTFTIKTPNAGLLLGTIHLPKSILKVETAGRVADRSAFTDIIADRLEVKTANLVINADYEGTEVPVPDGVGPTSTMVTLER